MTPGICIDTVVQEKKIFVGTRGYGKVGNKHIVLQEVKN